MKLRKIYETHYKHGEHESELSYERMDDPGRIVQCASVELYALEESELKEIWELARLTSYSFEQWLANQEVRRNW